MHFYAVIGHLGQNELEIANQATIFTDRSKVDHLCSLCLVCVMLSRLFNAAFWSPEGKWMTSWLLFVVFIVILLLYHLVSWDRCGT